MYFCKCQNNSSDWDVRGYVIKRKISGHNSLEMAMDTFVSLKKSCIKRVLAFWNCYATGIWLHFKALVGEKCMQHYDYFWHYSAQGWKGQGMVQYCGHVVLDLQTWAFLKIWLEEHQLFGLLEKGHRLFAVKRWNRDSLNKRIRLLILIYVA